MISENSKHTIGLILSNATNSFTRGFMSLFEKELYQKDYKLIIGLTNHLIEKERFYLEYFGEITDGILIFSDSSDYKELSDAIPSTIPTIFLHRVPTDCECTAIVESDYSATFQAILSMIHSGYPNVALICRNIQFSTNREIIRAYHAAMDTTANGFREDWIFECNDTAPEYLENLIAHITEKGCTGFLAASVEVTENLAPHMYSYNLTHEKPLLLTGFSTENYTHLLFDGLDTISRPIERMIDLALQQLFYHMSHPDSPHTEYLVKGAFQTKENNSFRTL